MRLLDLFVFKYNRTDFHELNLDWIISDMRTLAETLQNFISLNTIKYANPIQWNITTQYEANTVVIDPNDGTAYLSVQPVPTGVAITNTDYWTPIFTLNLLSANQNITLRDDGSNVLATFASNVDDWLIWNSTLYKVIQAINVNEAYVVGYNLTRYSVEMFISDYITALSNNISTLESNIGELTDLQTTDKTNLVNAVNELVTAITTASVSISAIETKLSDYLTPDDFTGSDGDKIQAAFDALENTGGTIILNRNYTLDHDILIKRRTSNPNHKEITVFGLGKDSEIDFDVYAIRGYDTNYRNYGGLRFINVKMTGTETAFYTDNLIRINLSNCDIWFFKYLFYGTDSNSCQSIYVSDCSIQYIKNCVHYAYRQAWDVHYNCNRIELCDKVFYIREAKVLTITNNVIEGRGVFTSLQGLKVIEIVSTYYDLVITGNYFEDNETTIDMSGCTNALYNHAVIEGNSFWEHLEGTKSIILPESVSNSQILLSHNTFSLAANSYSIAVASTGHILTGVQINGCNGNNADFYDPNNQLHDVANYNNDTFTRVVTLTDNANYPLTLNRYGKVCVLSGIVTLGADVAAGSNLITINNAYNAPMSRTNFALYKMNGAAIASSHRGNITGAGQIFCSEALTNGDALMFNVTWITR